MVRQNDDVRLGDEWQNRISESLTAWGLILGNWHVTDEDFDFWQYALWNRFACYRKGSCMRWMAMHNTLDVWTLFVDFQMQ